MRYRQECADWRWNFRCLIFVDFVVQCGVPDAETVQATNYKPVYTYICKEIIHRFSKLDFNSPSIVFTHLVFQLINLSI